MVDEEFKELIKKRKDWVISSRDNKFDFDNILSGLYNDPSHFIYEILQNAEDQSVGAKKVKFELFEDRLDIYHNGKDFDFQDIDGVTGIGISKKKGDLTQIGKFGIGFKSVFAITSTPYIFSGKYKIKIEDFVIPSVIDDDRKISGTLIQIPFDHSKRTKREVFDLVCKKLENLELKTLLFLKNIEEIEWVTPSSKGHYLKFSENIKNTPSTKRVRLESSKDKENYIVREKPIKIGDKDLLVEVAFKLGKDKKGKELIIQEPDSKLFVFFPTEKVTFLNFVIQGPYKTTPNRENIPLDDDQNKIIIEETGELIAESLSVIKYLGYLDTNFLSILPINSEKTNEPIYSVIYNKVKEKLLSDELLPTSDENYTTSSDAILADGMGLTEFLDKTDLQWLYSKKAWLDTNITQNTKKELREYLMNELNVVEANFESFVRKITEKFLQGKSDEWMIDFYSRLLGQRALWAGGEYLSRPIWKNKPIIRLDTDEHVEPFDNDGEVQVYLPTEIKSNYKTVKAVLVKNEDSLKFLTELGLRKPDIHAEVKELILPKYQKEDVVKDEDYFDDFKKILESYESIPANKKLDFKKELSNTLFVYSTQNVTGQDSLQKPSKIYFADSDLKEYFDGYSYVHLVSEELYKKFDEKALKIFLSDLGVEDKPRRILKTKADLSPEEKERWGNVDKIDYDYRGLGKFIEQMTANKSYLLWKLLLRNIGQMGTWEARKFFKGRYEWFYYIKRSEDFDANFLKTLRHEKWLVDKNKVFRKPSDITFSDLSEGYEKNGQNIEILRDVLDFKPEVQDQLPEDDRKMLEFVKENNLTLERLKKIISESTEEHQPPIPEEKTWTPECEPNKGNLTITPIEPDKIITPDLTGQRGTNTKEGTPLDKDKEPSKEDLTENLVDKKAIGNWGEKRVYEALKEKYQNFGPIIETGSGFKVITDIEEFEIIWLNKNQDIGKGYDISIKKNGTEIEYIEVKSKIHKEAELVEVQGTQWEFARKLFEQNQGEKYSFYVVLNAGKENASIKSYNNPIKLWKEGKLYAHPVNFEL